MPPKERHKLQPRNFEARPPGQPSSGLHMGYGGGQRPAVSYSSERGGPSDEYLKNPMGGGYEPYLTKEPTQTWNLMGSKANQPRNNSGVMLALANSPAVNKMKNIYSQFDPFFPEVDVGEQQIGYDFNKNLWGGNLGFGGEYDMYDDAYNAYINWGIDW